MEQKFGRVTFFTISLRKGGAENQLVKLAVSLKRKGYVVNIVSLAHGNDFTDLLAIESIEYVHIPIKTPMGIIRLFNYVNKKQPDVLITFMFAANIIGRITKLRHKIPLITSVRNNEISSFYKRIYRLTYKIDDLTTFNSEYALRKFVEEGLSLESKSVLIPNAVSISPHTIEKSEFNRPIFTIISIAHFRPQKDYKTLFEALKIVKDKGIKVKLIVLGHLFNQTWPQEMLANLNLKDEVRLVGFTNKTEEYIAQAEGLVLSSLWEGTPNAILEGMANRLPIIASNIPGNQELINNTKGGFLFEKQNASNLADKIRLLINLSRSETAAMGERGYAYVLDNYEEGKVHEKWEHLIGNVLRSKLNSDEK